MYHLTTLLVTVLTLFSGLLVLAQTEMTFAYDPNYDNAELSLDRVACSNGQYGLETKGYTTLGSLPNFPFVGGAYTVAGWDSPACGSCYTVTYGNTTINILAVDVSKAGFTVSEAAMNTLTENQATQLGRVNVSSVATSACDCGLSSS